MRNVLYCAVLFFAAMVLAQQQGQPPSTTSPPYQTPPTFPEGGQTPREQMPPDTQAPPQTMSNERVEGQIVKQLRAEPSLSRTNIDARANNNSVVLTGNVDTMAQHDLAVRIARANAGNRKILDNINVKQRT